MEVLANVVFQNCGAIIPAGRAEYIAETVGTPLCVKCAENRPTATREDYDGWFGRCAVEHKSRHVMAGRGGSSYERL